MDYAWSDDLGEQQETGASENGRAQQNATHLDVTFDRPAGVQTEPDSAVPQQQQLNSEFGLPVHTLWQQDTSSGENGQQQPFPQLFSDVPSSQSSPVLRFQSGNQPVNPVSRYAGLASRQPGNVPPLQFQRNRVFSPSQPQPSHGNIRFRLPGSRSTPQQTGHEMTAVSAQSIFASPRPSAYAPAQHQQPSLFPPLTGPPHAPPSESSTNMASRSGTPWSPEDQLRRLVLQQQAVQRQSRGQMGRSWEFADCVQP